MEMAESCAYRLSSLEPITEGLFHIEYARDGWSLSMRHRHHSGFLGDCDVEEYRALTTGELLDVLCAVIDQWGPFNDIPSRAVSLADD